MTHKKVRGTVLYEIKWGGYDDPADRTWEPKDNLYVRPKERKKRTKEEENEMNAKTAASSGANVWTCICERAGKAPWTC